jgi:two-component system, NarL family, nitrate/nitrite response regulator NarL
MDIRVLIVGDQLARAGLATLLAGEPGLTVAGQIDADEASAPALELYRPDVVLWDMGYDSAAAGERLTDLHAEGAQVLVLLASDAQAMTIWQSGARGLLLRDAETTALVAALAALAEGLVVLSPSLALALKATDAAQPAGDQLTPREHDVLQLLAEGLPNKAIARRLAISEHTVKFHINALMGKLGAQSRTEAVVRAMRLGLVSI